MAKDADTGIAVVIEGGSKATRENVKNLNRQNKTAIVYEISSDPEARRLEKLDLETAPSLYQDRRHDKWINDRIKKENKIQEKVDEVLKNYPGISAKVITK